MNTVGGSKGGVPPGYDFVSTVQYEYHNCPPVRAGYELQYVLYYSTQSRRRPSLHQASVKKGGPRGVSPLVRSGGGLKNRRFPPPSSFRRQRTILNIRAMPAKEYVPVRC